ncbi:MAG: CDC27 family protein [Sulfurovum sp.]|nr:CDC27 family protein [Sulfurovum sp.]
MYDIKQLEHEWKQYRKKKLKPWYIGSLSLFVFIVAVTLFLMNEKKIDFSGLKSYFESSNVMFEDKEKSIDTFVDKSMQLKERVLVDNALEKLEVHSNLIDVVDKVVDKPLNILVDIPLLDHEKKPLFQEQPETRKTMHLDIIESTSVSAYKDVEKRFLESRDIDDALFLASSYYKKGDYEKSAYWALEVNKLDQDMEEGLLIFVKSKVKMGRKNEGISILKTYVERSGSQEAKKLLYQIENDKL